MQEMTDLSSKSGNKESGAALGVASSDEPVYNEISYHEQGRWQDFKDSFKRDPNASIIASKVGLDLHAEGYDVEGAAAATVNTGLARKLKGRHLQMIAIGGSIGAFMMALATVHAWLRWHAHKANTYQVLAYS